MIGDWLTLDEGELVTWDGQPKLTTALPGVGVGIALLVGAVWLFGAQNEIGISLALAVVGVSLGLWAYLSVVNTEYVLSNQAVYAKRGVIGIRITE